MLHTDSQKKFTAWVDEYSDALYSYAANRGFDAHSAKDLVQETFISAWRNINRFEERASAKNWLFVILKNKIKDHFRKACSTVSLTSIENEFNDHVFFDEYGHWNDGAHPHDWNNDYNNTSDQHDLQNILNTCRTKLKEIQHAVFVMKYIDDMKSEQICKELSITSSNYWVILHRTKVQLRACVERNWLKK